MTEERIRELLREMPDEPLPLGSHARVRPAVDGRSRSRIAGLRRHWKLGAGILALAGVVTVAMLMQQPVRIAPPAVETMRTQTPNAIPAPVAAPPQAARRQVHRVPRSRRPNADTVFRMETDDPNIVIVLVGG